MEVQQLRLMRRVCSNEWRREEGVATRARREWKEEHEEHGCTAVIFTYRPAPKRQLPTLTPLSSPTTGAAQESV